MCNECGKTDALDQTDTYFEEVFDPVKLVETAKEDLKGVDYDTMVGTGLSGALAIPILALALGKKWAIVRKDGERSHAGPSHRVVGKIGQRWLFVDDFVSSGTTRERVKEAVRKAVFDYNACRHGETKNTTQYVGSYEYSYHVYVKYRGV